MMAARTPGQAPKSDPTITPVNAPPNNIPSIAMLITATRSLRTPARAPKVSGADRRTLWRNIEARLNDWPAAAHVRNAKRKSPMTRASVRFDGLMVFLVNSRAPRNPMNPATKKFVRAAGTTRLGSSRKLPMPISKSANRSRARTIPNEESPSPVTVEANTRATNSPRPM
ncbi:hypothetical protein BMS3Bbin02_01878 [bacterium BMS3Bbin02]|nr:hypothetical protein BMS3Bbin02_01878 [bacterium BMS3Bbin02]